MTRSTKTRIIVYSAIVGFFLGIAFDPIRLGGETSTIEQPLPHHFPKHKDNLSLRFAMVHDVIHERFTRHGPAYYAERNRRVQDALRKAKPDSDEYFALTDDLAVGLLWTGKPAEAVDMMRDKLKRQQAVGKQGKDLYSTYANLGTFLILWQFGDGLQKPGAKGRIRESIEWVKKSIEVNPDSHFGREQWQVVLEEFLLAVIDKPELLLKYDMIGDRLDQPGVIGRGSAINDPNQWARTLRTMGNEPPSVTDAVRLMITHVGAEPDWTKDVSEISKPAPFDEPTLGIVGMWTMGAGANPYFAVALGEIMLRVGQRHIAWSAFERAAETGNDIWPDDEIRRKFINHCRARQKMIEQQLSAEESEGLRKRFRDNLKHGQTYQQAYQDYEKQRIDKGKSIDDPKFYDEFFAARGQIASPVGKEDKFYTTRTARNHVPFPSMLLGAGLFAFVAALIVSRFPTKRADAETTSTGDDKAVAAAHSTGAEPAAPATTGHADAPHDDPTPTEPEAPAPETRP